MKYDYYIGIDTGVNTGFAVWNSRDRKFWYIETMMIHKALEMVANWSKTYSLFIRIEDARKRKYIPWQKDEKRERGRREGAGSVKRDAKIWEDFCIEKNIPFEMVAPKNNKTKINADAFRKMTGFKGRTNEHMRDSAMLVYGF